MVQPVATVVKLVLQFLVAAPTTATTSVVLDPQAAPGPATRLFAVLPVNQRSTVTVFAFVLPAKPSPLPTPPNAFLHVLLECLGAPPNVAQLARPKSTVSVLVPIPAPLFL